ncbi:tRNA wybutosine-synthesizing protein 2 homolog isoform X1 [Strigops habroptila]|nr:tRNA wybutosine-synthesizing protein 2 homolog isoform X1 [Strigops habroptila]XP_030353792.1 tRNA wybutosine-synthesizing protein 2 homolog isoform X1 [Strigops habroptila]XP_030353793.1 tRNA wybutosine-synthesizing protein 2 homolog isoform X1 [Strigops habroptila]XP_030353794.1 tRNA wybutosine-synthesizing protein 2 homolog isoform X1 [Strigops habroptila]XP_030353795.1 tRNA wybutosine-synthesizing protein 2 homolog isoform X1 [Strigops habroptila]
METRDVPISVPALATEPRFAQRLREHLEAEQLLDKCYQLQEMPGGRVALPVLEEKLSLLSLPQEMPCGLVRIQDPIPSRASRRRAPARRLRDELRRLLGESWSEELERDVPRAWQRHGDLVLLSEDSFRAAPWEKLGPALWETVASALGARRLARRGRVLPGGMRCPSVTLLLGQDPWVEHVDNGIRYTFDVTKCMFSPGNITEKLRVASLPCSGEVLVDLYAGIGYFTLPYLVHAAAAFAHACEWNSHAVEALRRNLVLNGVQDRCRVHHGDSREVSAAAGHAPHPCRASPQLPCLCFQLELRDVADRVNLGLIPSSEEGWPVACRVLKKGTGGVLHIHHNVEALPAERGSPEGSSPDGEAQHPMEGGGKETRRARIRPEWQRWAEATAARIRGLLAELHGQPWSTSILHIEVVKSYAPHVHHLVLDLECRPTLPTEPTASSSIPPDPTGR